MARFFFNVRDGSGSTADPDGLELPDVDAAWKEALNGARSIIAEEVCRGRLDLNGTVTVTDEQGATLFVLAFADAVTEVR